MKKQMMIAGGFLGLVVAFQNCSPSKQFTQASSAESAKVTASTGGETPTVPTVPTTPPVVICDPLTGATSCQTSSSAGLAGDLYSLNPNTQASLVKAVDNYINFGVKQNAQIVLSSIDVPLQNFSAGFRTSSGALKDDSGKVLNTFFALDLKGFLTVSQAADAGSYQFAVLVDDGAIVDLDGKVIINGDGYHAGETLCSSSASAIVLNVGVAHSLRLRYFQGPPQEIALRLLWRPFSKKNLPCDADDASWSVVPAAILSH